MKTAAEDTWPAEFAADEGMPVPGTAGPSVDID
jgi:hypothetical protein